MPSPSLVHSRLAALTPRSRTGWLLLLRIFVPTTFFNGRSLPGAFVFSGARRCNWRFQVRSIQSHRKGNSRFFDNFGAAAHFGQFRRVVQFENDDFVPAAFEPLARQEQRTQAAMIPEPAEVVAVDPDRAHAPIAHIEERAAGLIHDECAAIKGRAGVRRAGGLEIVHVVIGQRINLPAAQVLAIERRAANQSLAREMLGVAPSRRR